MIKENKDFFLYILGIIALIFITVLLFDSLVPNSDSEENCGLFGIRCWIEEIQNKEKIYSEVPEIEIDTSKDYKAEVETSIGTFEIDLYEKNAPVTVNNFVFLVNEDYYDNVKFHRVVKDLLVQAGDRNTLDSDPDNDGEGGPGYEFGDEINWDSLDFSNAKRQQLENLGFDNDADVVSKNLTYRSVAMANSGPDSNGSQFFIITASSSEDQTVNGLEGRHTVFGEITSGWDVIEEINDLDVDDPTSNSPKPIEDVSIINIEIKVS